MFEGIDVAPGVLEGDDEVLAGERQIFEEGPILSPGQERALAALLVQPTTEAAAKAAEVGLRTLRGWLVEDEHFIAKYRNARREMLSLTIQSLQDRAPALTHQLYEIVNDAKAPATARVAASRALLSFAFRGAEATQLNETEQKTKALREEARERSKRSGSWQDVPRPPEPLSGLQERALLTLMEYPTVSEAARVAGVGLRTLQRWIAEHQNFRRHYLSARREAFARTLKTAQDRAPIVVERVFAIASDPQTPCTARVMATRLLLDLSRRGTDLLDMADEVDAEHESLAAAERKRLGKALENQRFHQGWQEKERQAEAKRVEETQRAKAAASAAGPASAE